MRDLNEQYPFRGLNGDEVIMINLEHVGDFVSCELEKGHVFSGRFLGLCHVGALPLDLEGSCHEYLYLEVEDGDLIPLNWLQVKRFELDMPRRKR